jgi:hypothetical protein
MKCALEGITLLDFSISRNIEINSNFLAITVLLHVVDASVAAGCWFQLETQH